jgi:2-polyprenyl-3-methyl-5-hydroxy-6-metoxy-1,4-benzoquinol methylase
VVVRYLVCPWDAIIDQISDSGSVLDIGCGHGLFLLLAKRKFPHLHCVGFDHDMRKIKLAATSVRDENVSFVAETQAGQVRPSTFDFVTVIDVLYSVPPDRWIEIFSLAHKRLKPNGVLIIKETVDKPKWKYYICLAQETVALKILKYTKGHSPRLESVEFYLTQLAANDFVIREHRSLDSGYPWPHHMFVAKRGW